jgi:hypothetical protein
MNYKTHKILFLVLFVSLLLMTFTPLDYINVSFGYIHLWITIIYGVFLLITFAPDKDAKRKRIISSCIWMPIAGFISFYIYIVSPHDEVEITHVPKRNLIVTSQFYTLFMMGDPRVDISIGYPLLGDQLIWKLNSYTKNGEGERNEVLSGYQLPIENAFDGYGLYILNNENYLLDLNNNMVYPIQKK